jgi:ribosomal protein L34
MTILQPITLSEIDEYLEDLTAIVDTTKRALSLGLRARMAVSAGAQEVAYAHLAQVGAMLSEIYQLGNHKYWRSKKTDVGIRLASDAEREHQPKCEKRKRAGKNRPSKRTSALSDQNSS